jgi:hypothetical protein
MNRVWLVRSFSQVRRTLQEIRFSIISDDELALQQATE